MSLMKRLQDGDLEERARGVLDEVLDFGTDTVIPGSTERLRVLADRVRPDRYRNQVSALEGEIAKRVRRLERKLERQAKKLPVDTSLDRRRRGRARRRGAVGTMMIVGVCGAVAYAWWRSRVATRDERAEWQQARDRREAGEDRSGAREQAEASPAGGGTES